jgi:hypothetical protein
MLGNLGFNKAICLSTYVQLKAQPTTLTCEVGKLSSIDFAGIIPDGNDYTWENTAYGYCNDPNGDVGTEFPDQTPPGTQACTDTYLDTTSLMTDFSNECAGSHSC